MVPFICFGCGQMLQVDEALAGAQMRCPQCNHLGTVPRPARRADEGAGSDLPGSLARLWQQGRQPDVRNFLRDAGKPSLAETVAVLRVDQLARWGCGQAVLAETYLKWYPEVARDRESAVELIYGEYLLRENRGKPPELAEYLGRFPCHAERLRQQIELHQALGDLEEAEEAAADDWMILADEPSNRSVAPGSRRWSRRALLVTGGLVVAAVASAMVVWKW
jgi:hypothetical protein